MKRLAFALAFFALASGVHAQQRLSTLNLTCGQAQQVIRSRGAAVLSTGTYTYDRFVVDRSFCQFDEFLELAWVPTRDTPQCPIGYRCKTQSNWFDD
ncbi:hypothetical protein [Microvirga sp. TS319]|uniref:hypothetical protein n=1 Tax=Microvirga sp. TS319 TaxID=3241165 RepID=UPI003519FBC0